MTDYSVGFGQNVSVGVTWTNDDDDNDLSICNILDCSPGGMWIW